MNRTLTKQKDTDKMVLSLLEHKDLVNLCIASPNFWFYLDGEFWKEMLQKKHPTRITPAVSWKIDYLRDNYPEFQLDILKYNIHNLKGYAIGCLIEDHSCKCYNLNKRVLELIRFFST